MRNTPSALRQIIYVSSSIGLPEPDELDRLLRVSRTRNGRDGISGLLLYHEGSFMQLIEGGEKAVGALFSRIMDDPSHHNIVRLHDGPVAGRLFPTWSMGFAPLDLSRLSETGAAASFQDIRRNLAHLHAADLRAGTLIDNYFRMFRASHLIRGEGAACRPGGAVR